MYSVRLPRRVHRGGSPLPMNPPRSFKFRFKINGMRAHCASTFSRLITRACFIACACDVHSKDLIVAAQSAQDRYVCSSGRRVIDYNTLSRRGQGGSFRCKTVSTASVRKGAMTRRRASTATLFSKQNEEHRVQSHRFSGRLAYWEGISERKPASKIDQHRRRSTSGRCWAAADRSPAADIVLELRSS